MLTFIRYVLWLIQLTCLIVILIASWNVLERSVFAIVAAASVLAASLYVERETGLYVEPEADAPV